MATYNSGTAFYKQYRASVDLSASQYQFVTAGSIEGEVKVMSGSVAGSALGVLVNDPKATEEATVCVFGFTKVSANAEEAASPLVAGGLIKAASDGRATGMLNYSASTWSLGWSSCALATGSGVYIEMFVRPQYMAD